MFKVKPMPPHQRKKIFNGANRPHSEPKQAPIDHPWTPPIDEPLTAEAPPPKAPEPKWKERVLNALNRFYERKLK